MELITYDEEIKEILIEDIIKSNDKGKVITPGNDPLISTPVGPHKNDLTKEIIAYDSMEIGSRKASALHDVNKNSANDYANGERIEDPDVRARILGVKYNIADKAVAQLMETLNLFDPSAIEKQTDVIKAAGMLAGIVEKVSSNGNKGNGNEVHLHLYGPKQNKLDRYDVIDV